MAERSSLALLAILRRHGVTPDILETWVHVLESKTSGSMTFHHDPSGTVAKVDVFLSTKLQLSGVHDRLTKLLDSAIIAADCHSPPE